MKTATTGTDSVLTLVEALRNRSWPEPAKQRIRSAYIDAIACIAIGSTTDTGKIAAGLVRDAGGNPQSTVIGAGFRAPMTEAALVNGTAAHALDYDDIMRQLAHPSVVLVPAILAVAEHFGASGGELLSAYGIGFEVMSRILRYMNPPHFDRGWHATSTVGVLGATAALGHIRRLEGPALRNAFGIAVSSSSGLRKQYGSMVKPLHAGIAAHNAVLAVELASRGFVADGNGFDGDYGFLNVYRGDSPPDTDFIALMSPDRPLSIVESGLTFKRFACCGASHAAVDGILELRKLHPEIAEPANIDSIDATVNRLAAEILFHHQVHRGDEGRFSMEYSLAAAVLDGWLGVEQFDDKRVIAPDVQELSRRISMTVDLDAPVEYANWPAKVVVRLKNGKRFSTYVARPKGHPDNPLELKDLAAKFHECCVPALGEKKTATAFTLLSNLESMNNVAELSAALAQES